MVFDLRLVFLLLALVFFALAALSYNPPRVNLGWAGLFCLTLGIIFTGVALPAR